MILTREDLIAPKKSTYSDSNGACVTVGLTVDGLVGAFDSKVDDEPAIGYAPEAWADFIADIRRPGSPLAGIYA